MSEKLIVQAPDIEDRKVEKPILCGPGPCDVWPSVEEAYTKPVVSPVCDEYFNVIGDIRAGIQYIFQTRSKLILAMSGSGHSGMEAVITNLLGPNETLLIASRGIWDERALQITERHGIKAVITRVPMDSTFSFEQLENELKKTRPQALFITHGDSSTGTVQNLQGLGELCHKYGALLLVDTVVSLVGVPFFMDEWGVDGVYTSTQKALSGPAGISPVAFSERAEMKMNNRKHLPPFYMDIKLLAQQWNCYGNTRTYHHTMSPPLLWALQACLKEVSKETLPVAWARHAASTAHFHKRIQALKLQFLVPKPEDRLVTVTTVVLPKGYDYMEFVKYIRTQHNILIFGGLGPTAGKALRIGIMGINSTIEVTNAVADAITNALVYLRINAVITRVPMGLTFDLEQLENELKKTRPQALFITHGDSSTGTVQNLQGLGELCHKMKINNRSHLPPFYFDIKLLARQWNCYEKTRAYHHTMSPPLLWALRACIKEVSKETLPVVWARHAASTAHFHKRVQALKLQLIVPKPEDRLATVTTIVFPKSYDYEEVVRYIRAKYNILVCVGLGPTAGIALRVGIMGVNSTIEVADAVADAITDALVYLKKSSL